MEDEEPYTSCQKCKVTRTVPLMSPRPPPLPFSSCGLLPGSSLCFPTACSAASPHPCPPLPSSFLLPTFHTFPCPDIPQSSISCSLPPDSCTCRLWKAMEGCDPFNLKGLPARCPFAISHIHLPGTTSSDVGDSPCLPAVLFTSSPLALGVALVLPLLVSFRGYSQGWGMGGDVCIRAVALQGAPWSGPAVRLPRGRGWGCKS